MTTGFKLTVAMAARLAVACGGLAASPPPAAGQLPAVETKDKGANAAPARPVESDKDKLQGNWRIVSVALEDKVAKRDDKAGPWKDTLQKDLFVQGDRFGQVGYSNLKVTLDDTREPKRITIQDDDGKLAFRGIYALDGDALKVCMNGDGTSVCRPEEFVAKKGSAVVVINLSRLAAKK